MFARIENGVVREIIAMDQEDFEHFYPQDFRALCVECGNEVEQYWTYDGESFSPPLGPDIDEARASALDVLKQKRKSVEHGGFTFNGQHWDSEEKDELRLNSMITMMDKFGIPEFTATPKVSAPTRFLPPRTTCGARPCKWACPVKKTL